MLMIRLARKSGSLSEDGGDESLLEHKAVGGALAALDKLAVEMGVAKLSSFVSEDPENVYDLVDDEDEAEELLGKLPPVRWFPPGDALPTIDALLDKLPKGAVVPGIKYPAKVATELQDFKTILLYGIKKKATFRLYKEF